MRLLLDTNILVSAALFPRSAVAQAFFKAVMPPYRAVVCDYSMDELRRVFNEKFPDRIADYESFVSVMALSAEIIFTPPDEESRESESKIRDIKNRPILRAALAAKVDAIITGDRDFLEANLDEPKIMTAAEFLHLQEP